MPRTEQQRQKTPIAYATIVFSSEAVGGNSYRIAKPLLFALESGAVRHFLRLMRPDPLALQLEIDYVTGGSHKELSLAWAGPAPILINFGVTGEGHSVCCHVHGFEPYLYVICAPEMDLLHDICRFRQILERKMRELYRNSEASNLVPQVQLVHKKSITNYQQQPPYPFLKIVVALPNMLARCRTDKRAPIYKPLT